MLLNIHNGQGSPNPENDPAQMSPVQHSGNPDTGSLPGAMRGVVW